MTKEHPILSAPSVREYAHGLAYKLAREQLAGIADIEKQCRKSGAEYLPAEKAIILNYLNQSYRISPDGEVSYLTGGEEVPLRDKILLLHYLTRAAGTPLSGKMITYKELHEGINYFPVFAKRAIKPIVSHFGDRPEQLLKTAAILGGHKANYGDTAVTIDAFKKVPVTIVLWRGDEEFSPEGSLMFDSTISEYLSNDDIHTLCENIAWGLIRRLKAGGDKPGKN
jgi:hypothetical protein